MRVGFYMHEMPHSSTLHSSHRAASLGLRTRIIQHRPLKRLNLTQLIRKLVHVGQSRSARAPNAVLHIHPSIGADGAGVRSVRPRPQHALRVGCASVRRMSRAKHALRVGSPCVRLCRDSSTRCTSEAQTFAYVATAARAVRRKPQAFAYVATAARAVRRKPQAFAYVATAARAARRMRKRASYVTTAERRMRKRARTYCRNARGADESRACAERMRADDARFPAPKAEAGARTLVGARRARACGLYGARLRQAAPPNRGRFV